MTEILEVLISWPAAAIVAVLVFRKPLMRLVERLIESDSGKAKVGPVEIELGRIAEEGATALETLKRLNVLMAESRLLEMEITEGNFGAVFTPEQRSRMKEQIEELRTLTSDA